MKKMKMMIELIHMQLLRRILCLTLLLVIFMLQASPAAYAADDPFSTSCDGNSVSYTSNSTFAANLRLLFPSLTNASERAGHFYRTAVGQGADRVYGLVLCRGDATPDKCRSCITTASAGIVERCNKTSAVIWYDDCLLRYSTTNFFNSTANSPLIYGWNTQNATNASAFNRIVGELINSLASEAANQAWRRKFATGERNFSSFTQQVHGLVQCIPDMGSTNCYQCLQEIISSVEGSQCSGKRGCRFLGPVCNMRYEGYSFYGPSAIAAEAPAPPPSPVSTPQPPPSITTDTTTNGKSSRIIAVLVPAISIPVVLLVIVVILLVRKRCLRRKKTNSTSIEGLEGSREFIQFDLDTIRAATNDFSDENKLGEGGYGPVYKGKLTDGQEIAVKRLSLNSGQGVEEFRNEVALVAKLQHRNLVRLFGCCVEGDEKLLVYEFIPNGSLDYFLFDATKRTCLEWERRYKIIGGIARGLLYLHEDSRLRIIHRDLKASNILLDSEMNAKISDFGMAKIVGVDQTQGNTDRIAGTYGYMPPEYAMHGQFSVKSDVYSFGVLVFEIVTGQKNSNFYQSDVGEDLLSHAWKAWNDGSIMEIVDPTIRQQCPASEVMRYIHIGLLCVQEEPTARPNISSVVLMLNSFSITLPAPTRPAFFLGHSVMEPSLQVLEQAMHTIHSKSAPNEATVSINDVSITELEPR